jgi:hypothetical protein
MQLGLNQGKQKANSQKTIKREKQCLQQSISLSLSLFLLILPTWLTEISMIPHNHRPRPRPKRILATLAPRSETRNPPALMPTEIPSPSREELPKPVQHVERERSVVM